MKAIGIISQARRLVINKYNLLIIIISSVFSCYPIKNLQENKVIQYDYLTKKHVYTIVERMPVYKDGEKDFLDDFIKSFSYDYTQHLDENIQTILRLQFVIDIEGHLIGARIYNKTVDELTTFEKAALKALNLMQDWQAGKHNNKLVNVLITKTIHIDLNN